jgi:hypothetical protein
MRMCAFLIQSALSHITCKKLTAIYIYFVEFAADTQQILQWT